MKVRKLGDTVEDIHFPKAGVELACPAWKQPARKVAGEYARTTRQGKNVRGYEAALQRLRGGSRPGLVKHIAAPLVAGWVVQHLQTVTTAGTGVETNQSGRLVYCVAVSQGNVYTATPGDTSWTAPTNNTGRSPPLNFTGLMQSAANNQKLYFADGVNWTYYDPHAQTVENWTASAGTLPADEAGNTPRLIATWRGRTVLSGLLLDQQNWFMSRVGDPTDFDYAPLSPGAADAVAGNNSSLGLIGDMVTALIPYTDDVLIFGGDHTIFLMRGDPLAGGQIDLVTNAVGMAWGQAWCMDPAGTVYFMSNRTGVYSYVPGQVPQRISGAVDPLLQNIDTGANSVRLLWNDRYQGFHLFVTPLAAPGATTHYFYEARTGAWWQDSFGNTNLDPLACVTYDGNLPTDRVQLIGSWDGYVRAESFTAADDDGVAIASEVWIGPLTTPTLDEITLKSLQAVLGTGSGAVTWAVYVGATAEAAFTSSAVASGTLAAGRNLSGLVGRGGHAVYLKLSSTSQWALEQIRAVFRVRGLPLQRGY